MKSVEELKAEFEKVQKRTNRFDVTVTNNGPFTGKKVDGFKVDQYSLNKNKWVIYDNELIAYEKAIMFCTW